MKQNRQSSESEQQKENIEKSVLAFCGQAGLFPPVKCPLVLADSTEVGQGELVPVVAAVSGGADSMALLHILLALAPQLALSVRACHVNHGMRGDAADRDEAFVRRECCRLGVPLVVFNARKDGYSAPDNAGEDWARRLRYGYLERFAVQENVRVATAHTLSDQAETLLFRLARGTGVHGAAGIRPKRGIYIRPLLCLTRQDTETYCAAVGQHFVTDETNRDDALARNRIRHTAIPALTDTNSGAVHHMGAFCQRMADVDAYFSRAADQLLQKAGEQAGGTAEDGPWKMQVLASAEALVQKEAVYHLVGSIRDAEEKYICLMQDILKKNGGAVQIRKDIRFVVRQGILYRENALQSRPTAKPVMPLQRGEYDFGSGLRFCVEIQNADLFLEKIQSVHKKDLKNVADYAKIPVLSVLRTRMPGDRYRPAGRGVEKSLRRWQSEQKIPAPVRAGQPLLAAGSDVVWLWGSGFADGFAPTENTKKILRILPLAHVEEQES